MTTETTIPFSLNNHTWQRFRGGWRIFYGPSNFLVAQGPGWSLDTGRSLFAQLTNSTVEAIWPEGTEPRPSN